MKGGNIHHKAMMIQMTKDETNVTTGVFVFCFVARVKATQLDLVTGRSIDVCSVNWGGLEPMRESLGSSTLILRLPISHQCNKLYDYSDVDPYDERWPFNGNCEAVIMKRDISWTPSHRKLPKRRWNREKPLFSYIYIYIWYKVRSLVISLLDKPEVTETNGLHAL